MKKQKLKWLPGCSDFKRHSPICQNWMESIFKWRTVNWFGFKSDWPKKGSSNHLPSYVSLLKMLAVGSFLRRMCDTHPKDRICRKKKTPQGDSIFLMVAIFSPFCSWSLCISASHRGIRQCLCPCHRGIHFQPSRCHTGKKNETPQDWIKEKKKTYRVLSKKKKRKKVLLDKWWSRPSLGCTGRWHHTGWSGCCRSWSPACSPSPDPLWSRSCSCRSGRSPAHEQNTSGFCFER